MATYTINVGGGPHNHRYTDAEVTPLTGTDVPVRFAYPDGTAILGPVHIDTYRIIAQGKLRLTVTITYQPILDCLSAGGSPLVAT